jgi:DnaJ-domain-containing protein 1
MESPEITEDYYNTLGVVQTATLELIIRSYRRLASEVRPRDGEYTPAYQPVTFTFQPS